jgi:uncharacterized protein involved in outer membrane biogenesis
VKRFVAAGGLGVALLVGAGAIVWWQAGRAGGGQLEQWLARQIVGVIERYLVPEVEFATLDYQAPYTIVIDDLTLTAEDATVLRVERLRLELAEVPRYGEPIQIKTVDLDAPVVRLIQTADGDFVGLRPLVHSEVIVDPTSVPSGQRLSDILVLRRVNLADGQISYQRGRDGRPMILPGITMELNTTPHDGEPGWYAVAGQLNRGELFALDVDARINLDTGVAEIAQLDLRTQLAPDQYDTLPAELATLCEEHQVQGQLSATASGVAQLTNLTASTGTLTAHLTDTRFSSAHSTWPLDSAEISITAQDAAANATLAAQLLGGAVTGKAHVSLRPPMPLDAQWEIAGVRLERALQAVDGAPARYAGRVDGQGSVSADAARLPDSLAGSGTITVREGSLLNVPVLAKFLNALENVKIGGGADTDEADIQFTVRPDHVQLADATITFPLLRVIAVGPVYFDQRLDLVVSTGALGKLQDKLGKAGEVIGALSGKIVQYTVRGTVAEPKVGVKAPKLGG